MSKKALVFMLVFSMLVIALPACQAELSDLQTQAPLPYDAVDAGPTFPRARAAFESGEPLYYEITPEDDEQAMLASDELTYISQLSNINIGYQESEIYKQYRGVFLKGPASWQDQPFESITLADDEAGEFMLLAQRFIYAVDDMQGPGFIQAKQKGILCIKVPYTPDEIREAQRAWQQQIFSDALFAGLEASGQPVSWVPDLIDNGLTLCPVMMFIAIDNAVLRLFNAGQPERYAMLVLLYCNSYSMTDRNPNSNFMYEEFRSYMSRHPEQRLQNVNTGNTYQWLILERDDGDRLVLSSWETNHMHNGVADAVIYDETGVHPVWFDRSHGLLDGYEMTTLDYREEEALARRLYDKGVGFITEMYTLEGADMADTGFDAARAMMAPELIAAMEGDRFFDDYLANIRRQDIHMTPYFNEDPLDEQTVSGGTNKFYVQHPMQCLAKLTKPGAPDLYMISFCWNYEGFSSNVHLATPDIDKPMGTLDITDQEGMTQNSDLSVGQGHLAILTFVEQDGQLQVVNWQTRGR